MKSIFTILGFLFSAGLFAQSYSGPESVEWDAANNRWLISNTTSHAILARTPSGTLSTFVPSTTNGPHGIEILGNVLYACCGSRIKGYNLSTGAEVFNVNLGASFLNGLTTDGDSVLYATDFSNRDIFRINPTTGMFYMLSSNTGTSSPNGIIYDGPNNRCIFVNWGGSAPIKAIDLTPPYNVTTITSTTLGNCDGITRDHLGYYYVTAWSNNRVNRFANDFTGGHTVMNGWTLSNPADIDCKWDVIDTIGVPNSGNNTCTFIPLAPPVASFTLNDSAVCEGDQITYTNTSSNADMYNWTFNGGAPSSGSTSPINITYNTAGSYTTTLTATNVYGTTTSTHTINVNSSPLPSITAAGNDLSVTSVFDTYQWYQDGVLIPGATSQNYTVTSGGAYTCVVSLNGCDGTSNSIVSNLGVQEQGELQVRLFPNPATDYMTLEFNLSQPQQLYYTINDIQGRLIYTSGVIQESTGINYLEIPVNELRTGVYLLKLYSDKLDCVRQFIVTH